MLPRPGGGYFGHQILFIIFMAFFGGASRPKTKSHASCCFLPKGIMNSIKSKLARDFISAIASQANILENSACHASCVSISIFLVAYILLMSAFLASPKPSKNSCGFLSSSRISSGMRERGLKWWEFFLICFLARHFLRLFRFFSANDCLHMKTLTRVFIYIK